MILATISVFSGEKTSLGSLLKAHTPDSPFYFVLVFFSVQAGSAGQFVLEIDS
ncbi:MAG: hypothetical protein ABR909_02675 [Candidatus Bathyarchaeia archaeon]